MLQLRKPRMGYSWLKGIARPDRYLRQFMSHDHMMQIDCIVSGAKFIDMEREQIWGSPFRTSNRRGKISFFFDRSGVYDRVKDDPDIFMYWERLPEHGEARPIEPPKARSSHVGAGRPSHEACHDWDEAEIRTQITEICKKVNHGMRLDEACMLHNISMWSFKQLFQLRYPGEYYEWTNNRKIPQEDNLAKTLVKRFPAMSGIS